MPCLEELYIEDQNLEDDEQTIEEMPNLEVIILRRNISTKQKFGPFPKLKRLTLSQNKRDTFEKGISFKGLPPQVNVSIENQEKTMTEKEINTYLQENNK